LRAAVRRLSEQPVESFLVDENDNGFLRSRRLNEHTFHGTTGSPVCSPPQSGTAVVKLPYSGEYGRESWIKGVPKNLQVPVTEGKTVSGVMVLTLAVGPTGVRLADYQQTETGGEVTDTGHRAQQSAKAAVLALLRDVLPER
jgi:hypothetical protein